MVGVVLPDQIGKLPAKQPKDKALKVRQGLNSARAWMLSGRRFR